MSKTLPSLSFVRKLFTTAVLFLLVTAFFSTSVSAFELSPGNMVLPAGGSNTVNIIATESNTNGVSVHVTMKGVRVTDFTAAEGVLNIGICGNGTTFDTTEVCVDLATQEDFVIGQVLGSFTVVKEGSEDATMEIEDDSKYANGTSVPTSTFRITETAQPGVVEESTTTKAINDVLPLIILAALILILIVLLLIYITKKKKETTSSTQTYTSNQSQGSANVTGSDKPMLPPLN